MAAPPLDSPCDRPVTHPGDRKTLVKSSRGRRTDTQYDKQMNKETKLRIHNITAKAALKYGSEIWVLKKREEQHLEATQMKFLRNLE